MLLFVNGDGGFDVNLGEKRATMEFFRDLSLETDVGVMGAEAKDDGVSMVVAADSGVKGVSNDVSDNCFSFRSRE